MEYTGWAETANTVVATLETALFGESFVDTGIATTAVSTSRKHARKANSDAMSDIEVPGSPVKRRRESGSTPPDARGSAKPTSKSRRISSALSNQFARSLSMAGSFSSSLRETTAYDHDLAASSTDMDSPMSSAFSLSTPSSTSSASSASAWPSSGLSMHPGNHHTNHEPSLFPSSTANKNGLVSEASADMLRDRVMKLPALAGRSIRAREKTRDNNLTPNSDSALGQSHSSLDIEFADSISPLRGSNRQRAHSSDGKENSFATLLKPLPHDPSYYTDDKIQLEIQQWALHQSRLTSQAPEEAIAALNQHIARLKELLPAILGNVEAKLYSSSTLHSDTLREFYRAALEMAAIGDWLGQRQFHLLPVVFPTLDRSLAQLKAIIRVARISEDMYELVHQMPLQFSESLGEMSNAFEELVYAKRSLYSDMLSQDGLSWKAMGIPIDAALLVRVRQVLSEICEQCLTRAAQVFERRARSTSACSREDISTDSLLNISHQVLHAAALCASLCGNSLPDLTPHVMFIVAESVLWSTNKLLSKGLQRHSSLAPSLYGKKLDSRALRLVQVCESLLKLLAYAKAILTTTGSPLEVVLGARHVDSTVLAACETLSTSLVDLSWSLAEIMAAYRENDKLSMPSGSVLLFAELLVKFARRVADFGASKSIFNIHQRICRMQNFGSEVIYNYIVEPYLVKNEEQLDRYFRQARAAAHRSTEKVSMSAYDKWVGYMQRVVSQSDTSATPAMPEQAESSGLGGLLKSVSQKVPQPSTAANYLASMAGISQKPQTDQPDPADKPSIASMLTSWAASFSAGSSSGISDQQRLQSIQTRKLQLQKLVSQLENSERTIINRRSAKPVDKPESSSPQTDASEFEDDAVMVGQPSAESSAGSNTHKETANSSAEPVDSKSQPAASTSSRRWFW
ncbi:hypothetical protein IWW36_002995 [Coemansia brasiliensis]|uniref:Uncharacterized protein n=1 Tax=Coemansia brasiliensis TaxID=2650707 RepID=A0A9W8I697_9FUNG|nr:hypothetical protein IWW36_002995 [Coemansia brasiliensis]